MAYDDTATTVPEVKTGVSEYEGYRVTRSSDGEVAIQGPGIVTARIPKKGDFDENLADNIIPESDLKLLAMRLKEFAEVDKDSRRDWEEREKRALNMMGIKDIPKDDKETENLGGHDVTHPALMEAATRFQANAIVELFPPQGPAETKILGKQTPPKLQRAHRVRTFVNHYLTDTDEGYFNDTDKMTMYLPMGGSVFRRAAQDFTTGLPILRHVKATNFLAPYAGTDLKSMPRYAWKFTMTGEDIDTAQEIRMFRDIRLPAPPPPQPGDAMHAPSSDQSDERVANLHDRDRLYDMLEYHIELKIPEDLFGGGADKKGRADTDIGRRPYVVVMDATNEEVLMVRRNWRKKDKQHNKRIWFAHHQFLPGLGFYGWGYPHVIGSLGNAASGAVNSLLDAALAANFQGGFVSKEAKLAGEFRLEHGVWAQCDSSAEDLAKSFYTPPFKEPSPALFQLLEGLVGAVQRFAGTTDAAVGDGKNTGPVGTTIALIDQAQKPVNAIHKRLHVSMSQELQMLCDLIEDFMPERYDYKIGDESQFLLKADFAPGVDVICVTDPAISSDTQRVMRAQALIEMQEKDPTLYPPAHKAEAHRRMLVALKVPNIDAVGPVVKTPEYLDAVSENSLIFAGLGVMVFPTQDDRAHIAIHQDGLQRASALYPPEVFQKVIQPAMMAHIRDHMAKSYYKQMMTSAGLSPQFAPDGSIPAQNPQLERQITAKVVSILQRLPHPTPKPGTPSAEQAMSDAKIKMFTAERQAQITQAEQKFQAEERRKQQAFENEERRKDHAMLFQEGRLNAAGATEQIRQGAEHRQGTLQKHGEHVQDLIHAEQKHDQGLEHGQESHEAGLDQESEGHTMDLEHSEEQHQQGMTQGAETHEQGLEQGQEGHEAGMEQGAEAHEQKVEQADKLAQAAAGEETDSDSHTGGSVK